MLCVVIPILNEVHNVRPMVEGLERALKGLAWRAVFVDDDSSDGTLDVLRHLCHHHPHIRFIHRIHRRGLASACIEGMLSSAADVFAVMDGDLQHDETMLPKMLSLLEEENLDMVSASRFLPNSTLEDFSALRQKLSRWGNWLANLRINPPLTDPLTGFFVIRANVFLPIARHLSQQGFKILVDILLTTQKPLRYREVPMVFHKRSHGSSKLNHFVMLQFLYMVLDKSLGHLIPLRFLLYTLSGIGGMLVNIGILGVGLFVFKQPFEISQGMAATIAISVNFLNNNYITYHERRLQGRKALLGLLRFYCVCAVGLFCNVGAARFLFLNETPWYIAGLLGFLLGGVWNHAVSSHFVWKK